MQPDETKAQGLLRLLARGLLVHSELETMEQLGDRSGYVGMSDIGKGMECLRAAVASKLGMSCMPPVDAVTGLSPEDLAKILGRQVILQRGHWQEHGIQLALEATGVKLVSQLEIATEYHCVPIKAHLDFTLVWGGQRPAVRILELKSNERIPDALYASYEAQVYGQVGLLQKCWAHPCFSVPSDGNRPALSGVTFPEAMHTLFGIALPATPDGVDIEAWVLSISLAQVRPFGPYRLDQAMLGACLQTAETIWRTAEDVRSGNLALNDLDHCRGFHPLCDWCDVNTNCPKYQTSNAFQHDQTCADTLAALVHMKQQRKDLDAQITETENRIKAAYALATKPDERTWCHTDGFRFRVANMAGRSTLDKNLLMETLSATLGDESIACSLLNQSERTGPPFQRLYVSPLNVPSKSAA